jgi:hypothetical protein
MPACMVRWPFDKRVSFVFFLYVPIYKYMYSIVAGPPRYASVYLAYPVDPPRAPLGAGEGEKVDAHNRGLWI